MVQGAQDDIVPPDSVKKLVDKLTAQKGIAIGYHLIPGAGHFFTDQVPEMSQAIDDYLEENLPKEDPAEAEATA